MSYQVLARKWRPRDFDSLVGQEHVVKALVNALEQQRLQSGESGPSGAGTGAIETHTATEERATESGPPGGFKVGFAITVSLLFSKTWRINALSNSGRAMQRRKLLQHKVTPLNGGF